MKNERIFLMNFLIFLTICLLFGAAANAADPGQSFWSLNVGNYWTYSGNSGAYTYTEEVQAKGTSPCLATHYKVEGLKDGNPGETNCLEISLSSVKLCRLEFYYSGLSAWVKIVPTSTCPTVFKNPITSNSPENIDVTVTIGSTTIPGTFTLTSTITVIGQEDVTIGLGDYYAYKVHAVQSVTVPGYGAITKDEYGWFVPYLGIIKVEEGGDSEVLTSLKIKKGIADLNGDGKSDLAGINSANNIFYTDDLSSWTIMSEGTLQQLVWGDFDGDGLSDLAGLNSANNIFYTTNLTSWNHIGGELTQLVVGDFNGDGKSDLAGINSLGEIWYTTDLTNWTQIFGNLTQLVVGDFDGDGLSDLAGINSAGDIWYTTDLANWTNIPGKLTQLVAGDFNGDGISDLAGINSNHHIFYTTNLSTWTIIPGAISYLVVGDFNGDGLSDLAGVNFFENIFYTTNLSTWTNIPGALSYLVVGDFNGDGKSELAGVNSFKKIFYTTNLSSWDTVVNGELATLADFDSLCFM